MEPKRDGGVARTLLALAAVIAFGSGASAMELPTAVASAAEQAAEAVTAKKAPRIVNIYNFIRNEDYRLKDSEAVLFEATAKQMELNQEYRFPITWALQYDALINPKYQALLKETAGADDEIACWWELPRQLVEKAGIKWRGHDHNWDSTANVGFSPGYTPDERKKLVDVYMADFKAIFGRYPKTAGSWFIDEVTLAYMAEKYGVIASCNCKDQLGTDGYTLWGGYWNGAYYPSRVNAYMPAQTKAGQIDVPVFRMLGSDPIYQYWQKGGMWTLEPVYANSGGNAKWVDWFFKSLTKEPCLSFGYTQAGQENSFGWKAMQVGYELQMERLAKLSAAGEVRIETLESSGNWFRENHKLTPATAVVALDDFKNEGRRSVWFNSRFYRVNWLWEKGSLSLRDLHRFDEGLVSPTHGEALKEKTLAYGTLPVMAREGWRGGEGKEKAVGIPRVIDEEGRSTAVVVTGEPEVEEVGLTALTIRQKLDGGGRLSIRCSQQAVTLILIGADGKPSAWEMDLLGGGARAAMADNLVVYQLAGRKYAVRLGAGTGAIEADGVVRLKSDKLGTLTLMLGLPATAAR